MRERSGEAEESTVTRNKALACIASILMGLSAPAAAYANTAGGNVSRPLSARGSDAAQDCPKGSICFYFEVAFGGEPQVFEPPVSPEHSCRDLKSRVTEPGQRATPAKSVINNTGVGWWLFTEKGCKGGARRVAQHTEVPDLEVRELEVPIEGAFSWY
jgi:hypothetical protein